MKVERYRSRKCCVYMENSGKFVTCMRAIDDRPYIHRRSSFRECRGVYQPPGRKCCVYMEVPGEFVTCTRAIDDRPYICRRGSFRECRGGYYPPGGKCCVYMEVSGEFAIFSGRERQRLPSQGRELSAKQTEGSCRQFQFCSKFGGAVRSLPSRLTAAHLPFKKGRL